MTYADREEAYKAGLEGRSVHTPYGDEYERGQRDRKKKKKKHSLESDTLGSGGVAGIVGALLLVVIVGFFAGVLLAALMSVVATFVVMLAARLPPRGEALGYRDAYKATFAAIFTWLAITLGLVYAAWFAGEHLSPGGLRNFAMLAGTTSYATLGTLLAPPLSVLPTLDGMPPLPSAPLGNLLNAANAAVLAPGMIVAVAALRFGDADLGWLRACIAAPVAVITGVLSSAAVIYGVALLVQSWPSG